jgi:enterochelin esterase-like enzyme
MKKLSIIMAALIASLILCSCADNASEPVDKPQDDIPLVTAAEDITEAVTSLEDVTEDAVSDETEPATEATTEPTTEAVTTVTTAETAPKITTAATTAAPQTTPTPATTPEPTTASIAVEPASGKMYAVNSVNVRSGPDTGYQRLGHLDKAEDVDITGICENGWYRIKFKGGEGFVSGKYLSKDKPAEVTTTVTTTAAATTAAPKTTAEKSETASQEKPETSGKTAAEIGEEFMASVKTVMNCPQKFESDWVSAEPHHPTKNGKLKRITYYSTTCEKNRTARVYLPDCYDESKEYPVMYILHGYWGHDNSMAEDEGCQNIIGKMIKAGECEEMIVVFPDIFASKTKDSCDAMNDENNRAYDNCLNDITKDLMPYIEKNYSCKTGRENTAIFGFSMGGREAIAMGFKYPEKFGYIGASCPAPGVQDVVPEDKMYYKEGYEPYLFMICAAGDDQVVWTTPQSYHDIFTKHKLTHVWWTVDKSWHGGPANHSMAYNFAKYAFKAK